MTAYLKDLTRQKYPLGTAILLCLFFALSSGCSQSDSTIDNYQSRLFKVLSIDESPTPSTENSRAKNNPLRLAITPKPLEKQGDTLQSSR